MIIKIRVKTQQKEFSVIKGNIWTVSLKSKPENNKANQELIKELSKIYGKIRIISGLKSKTKTIEIEET